MFVMGGAVVLNIVTFYYIIHRRSHPILVGKLDIPTNNKIDLKLILGAAIFGTGWGLAGFCPGPVMIDFFNTYDCLFHLLFIIIG